MNGSEASKRNLEGHSAIVTGASRGIGAATAIMLAAQGADVAIAARDMQCLDRVKKQIEASSVRCFASSVDVFRPEELERFVQAVGENLYPADILINNAGIYKTESIAEHSLESWRSLMDTNLTSAMWASKLVLSDMMKRGWGRIVNISSISGKMGEAYGAAYSASKFGMVGLTQSLALETARLGITVNAVCPGWVETDMSLTQLNDEEWCKLNEIPREESVEIARLSVPQQRFIQPEEVAALVCFLVSEQARSITGQAINICGGLTLH
ncbi:MAG TPA: SDR family NAD(P)-dependent oxidoreductase [Planktothrix sp.]